MVKIMDNSTEDEVLELFENLINEVETNKSEQIIEKAKKYKYSLEKGGLSDKMLNDLDVVDQLVEMVNENKNKQDIRIILATLQYFIDPWDIIPDVDLKEGLIDDVLVLKEAKNKLSKKRLTKKRARKNVRRLKLKPSSILDDLGYNAIKHILTLCEKESLYNYKQRAFINKMANINRANKPINIKERVYLTTLIERFFRIFWKDANCKDYPCQPCYKLKKVYEEKYIKS